MAADLLPLGPYSCAAAALRSNLLAYRGQYRVRTIDSRSGGALAGAGDRSKAPLQPIREYDGPPVYLAPHVHCAYASRTAHRHARTGRREWLAIRTGCPFSSTHAKRIERICACKIMQCLIAALCDNMRKQSGRAAVSGLSGLPPARTPAPFRPAGKGGWGPRCHNSVNELLIIAFKQ
jgi:hypothetical protein